MLALYDHVRRVGRTVDDFDRLLRGELEPAAESDRGAAQLLEQTRFLAAAFRALRVASGREQARRRTRRCARLIARAPAPQPLRHLVDRDRRSSVRSRRLLAGRRDAVHDAARSRVGSTCSPPRRCWTPVFSIGCGTRLSRSRKVSPERLQPLPHVDRSRSRDDARGVRLPRSRRRARRRGEAAQSTIAAADVGAALDRTGLVVARPLPYLYLAREVFAAAGIRVRSARYAAARRGAVCRRRRRRARMRGGELHAPRADGAAALAALPLRDRRRRGRSIAAIAAARCGDGGAALSRRPRSTAALVESLDRPRANAAASAALAIATELAPLLELAAASRSGRSAAAVSRTP